MPTTTSGDGHIERLVRASRAGGNAAGHASFEHCYRELRAIAQQQLARERRGHTLAPTSLVHEVFVRLHGSELLGADREQFLRLAATVMRHVLVDSARRRLRRARVEALPAAAAASTAGDAAILRLEAAMERLAAIDERLARVVELRFLVGLDVEQTANVLACGSATVKRDWRAARAFLQREIARDDR